MDFLVSQQGKPLVNSFYKVADGQNVIAAAIDMASKHCIAGGFLDSDGVPGIFIEADDSSLNLKPDAKYEDTLVEFPKLKGFRVFSAHIARYTLNICFVRYPAVRYAKL